MDLDDYYVPERIACNFCQRKFNPDSLIKHLKVCEKTSNKKRKVFDSAKQRIKGTDLAEFLPAITQTKKRDRLPSTTKFRSRWKENHIELIKIIKAARNDSNDSTDYTMTENRRSRNSSVTRPFNQQKCPHCDRSFGPKSIDRHIEWCKEKSARIDQKSCFNQEAKERLEARVRYKAPIFRSRRSITREKYAPKGKDKLESTNDDSTTENQNISSVTQKPMVVKENAVISQSKQSAEKVEPKKNNFIRQNVLRCSYKSRLPNNKNTSSPFEKSAANKTNPLSSSYTNLSSSVLSKNQFMNSSVLSATGTGIKPSQTKSAKVNVIHSNKKNETVQIRNSDAEYDPYLSAELQMRELMRENDFFSISDEDLLNGTFTISSPILTPSPTTAQNLETANRKGDKENLSKNIDRCSDSASINSLSRQTSIDSIKQSPTSAFSKYSNGSSNTKLPNMEERFVDTNSLITSFDHRVDKNSGSKKEMQQHFLPPVYNMSRSAVDVFDYPSASSTDNHYGARYPLVSLSNLSLCSSVSLDIPEASQTTVDTEKSKKQKAASRSAGNRQNDVAEKVSTRSPVFQRSLSSSHTGNDNSQLRSSLRNKRATKTEQPQEDGERDSVSIGDGSFQRYYGNDEENDFTKSICMVERSFLQSVSDLENAIYSNFTNEDLSSISPGSSSNSSGSFKNAISHESKRNASSNPDADIHGVIASTTSRDSGYNRSPPISEKLHTRETKMSLDSGINSKSSTPFISSYTPEIEGDANSYKMSKYCHECGAKYPVAIAKFCCECGVRRLVL